MNRFLLILLVLFIIFFIGQQSHFIEKKVVQDSVLRVDKEEYHMNWQNLTDYLGNFPENLGQFFSDTSKRIKDLF